jgi:pyruvate kinase
MIEPDLNALNFEVETLVGAVRAEGAEKLAAWSPWIERAEFRDSAANLACYMALRHRDIRPLQRSLTAQGLSSLGRLESRVLATFDAVLAALGALNGSKPLAALPGEEVFFNGEQVLARRTIEILGPPSPKRAVYLLVTCPSEAASDASFMRHLAESGVEAVRINCAHDDSEAWARMIAFAHEASAVTGRPLKVLMDLAGPKIRTGEIRKRDGKRVMTDERFAIAAPGKLKKADDDLLAVECTLPQALAAAKPGERVFIDDGKLATVIEAVKPWGVIVRVTSAPDEDGYKMKEEKGINFPDTHFTIPALTEKDIKDLEFVARHADGIEFSFVQSADDVAALQAALAAIRPDDWQTLSLVLKIETTRALGNLPEIVVRAAGRQPTAIMIARGDLAVEIGFSRLAEMQEEILWIGEAAQVPVIWATQVLEHLITTGYPSRGEMTDAAMGGRAECVMLNKGPHLLQAIVELDTLLSRMGENQHKKTPRLRKLASW